MNAQDAQIEELTQNPDLDETDILLLKEIASAQHSEPTAAQFAKNLGLSLILVEQRLYRLVDLEYARGWSLGGPDRYQLEQKGREYVIKKKSPLLSQKSAALLRSQIGAATH